MTDEPILDAKTLARTYDGDRTVDALERVQQYHEAMRFRSKHLKKGSSAIANALDCRGHDAHPDQQRSTPSEPADTGRRTRWWQTVSSPRENCLIPQ